MVAADKVSLGVGKEYFQNEGVGLLLMDAGRGAGGGLEM